MTSTANYKIENMHCPQCLQSLGCCDWCDDCELDLQCAATDEGLDAATHTTEPDGTPILILAPIPDGWTNADRPDTYPVSV